MLPEERDGGSVEGSGEGVWDEDRAHPREPWQHGLGQVCAEAPACCIDFLCLGLDDFVFLFHAPLRAGISEVFKDT